MLVRASREKQKHSALDLGHLVALRKVCV